MDITAQELKLLKINQIASFIHSDWKKVSPYAMPYLGAMLAIESIHDQYLADTAYSVVAYFLSNASTYRGENAKLVKAELKRRMKEYEIKQAPATKKVMLDAVNEYRQKHENE
jgi:hypothetical protein